MLHTESSTLRTPAQASLVVAVAVHVLGVAKVKVQKGKGPQGPVVFRTRWG